MRFSTHKASILLGTLGFMWLGLAVHEAHADQVYLTNGKVLEGKARTLEDGRVEVQLTFGTLTLPGEKVERIEQGATLEERVQQTLRTLPASDVASRYDLARWCREQGSHTLSRRLMEEVLALDPNHAGARDALGYRLVDGQWLTDDEYHQSRGEMLFEGQWLPVETVHRLLAARASHQLDERVADARRAEREADLARLALLQEAEREAAQREATPSTYGLPFYPPYGTTYGVPVVTVPTGHRGQTGHTGQMEPSPSANRRPGPNRPPRVVHHDPQPHTTTLKKP